MCGASGDVVLPRALSLAQSALDRIGRMLSNVMNPVAMNLLFFTVFAPAAMILRWGKKDLLTLARDPNAET